MGSRANPKPELEPQVGLFDDFLGFCHELAPNVGVAPIGRWYFRWKQAAIGPIGRPTQYEKIVTEALRVYQAVNGDKFKTTLGSPAGSEQVIPQSFTTKFLEGQQLAKKFRKCKAQDLDRNIMKNVTRTWKRLGWDVLKNLITYGELAKYQEFPEIHGGTNKETRDEYGDELRNDLKGENVRKSFENFQSAVIKCSIMNPVTSDTGTTVAESSGSTGMPPMDTSPETEHQCDALKEIEGKNIVPQGKKRKCSSHHGKPENPERKASKMSEDREAGADKDDVLDLPEGLLTTLPRDIPDVWFGPKGPSGSTAAGSLLVSTCGKGNEQSQ